jgi:hypothetical protein
MIEVQNLAISAQPLEKVKTADSRVGECKTSTFFTLEASVLMCRGMVWRLCKNRCENQSAKIDLM